MASHCGCLKITADDAACSSDIDRGILDLTSAGLLTRAAAFSTYGRLKSFSRLLDSSISLGIHFNLSSGRPLSKAEQIRSLIDTSGRFHCPTKPKRASD